MRGYFRGVGEPVIARRMERSQARTLWVVTGARLCWNMATAWSTRYGHLRVFAVIAGQRVRRGDVIGYVGLRGEALGLISTMRFVSATLPVNPYKYLRMTWARHRGSFAAGDVAAIL